MSKDQFGLTASLPGTTAEEDPWFSNTLFGHKDYSMQQKFAKL